LWRANPVYHPVSAWSPDWGYGFPCRMSESLVRDVPVGDGQPGPMQLIKLHGSVNWRIPHGHSRPYGADAIRHHEPWFEHYGPVKVPLDRLSLLLEPEPFMVPPVLTKSDLIEQPILRTTWRLAIDALESAKNIVFIGYSLPITDIAARFLFQEGLFHLEQPKSIIIVDFAGSDVERRDKSARLLDAYQRVFPGIIADQFDFSGAVEWV